jgi:hypothetical protein
LGRYAIGQGSLSAGANYAFTFVGSSLTITPRPLTIAADAQNKVYGTVDPVLTYRLTADSLLADDTLTGSLARQPGDEVGRYTIGQGSLRAGGN